ncbi:MAG: SCO family protein, partial [Planctomycetes bacterium]|nr:SCO family protein [Planctomycetota bacterium]
MRRFSLALMVLLSGAGLALGMWGFLRPEPPPRVEGYPVAPEFTVTAHDGSTLRSADLRGRPWLAAFVFTRCTTVCPIVTSRLSELARILPPSQRIVAFSVDPDHDSTEVLSKHAAGLGADVKRWAFAGFSGKADRDRVVKGFALTTFDTPEDTANPIAHDVHIALVDAEGMVRGWYDTNDAEKMTALRRDATALSLTGFYGLPVVNATLNAVSAVLLTAGLAFILAGRREPHVAYVSG